MKTLKLPVREVRAGDIYKDVPVYAASAGYQYSAFVSPRRPEWVIVWQDRSVAGVFENGSVEVEVKRLEYADLSLDAKSAVALVRYRDMLQRDLIELDAEIAQFTRATRPEGDRDGEHIPPIITSYAERNSVQFIAREVEEA